MKKNAVRLIVSITLGTMVLYFTASDICTAQTGAGNGDRTWKDGNVSRVNDVRALIYGWLNAWQSKDIDTYISFYSPKFQTKDFDYAGWLQKKSKLFQKPGKISLEIFYLGVFVKNSHAYVSFIQKYKDAYHSDIGEKNMAWVYSNGKWEIVSEEWKRLGSDGIGQ